MAIAVAALALAVAAPAAGKVAAEKSGAFYDIMVETAKSGARSTATIAVTGKNGYHCNIQYPWKLTLTADPAIKLDKTVLRKADAARFTERSVAFLVSYEAGAGKTVSAELKLSLCNDKQCQMETVSLSWPAK
ncbi:MAG: hypothetical protein PHU25_11520 [Deltaproteobacteria bacterium]|nr:hypothetical protein [Deltaproteobacteria bacterium]